MKELNLYVCASLVLAGILLHFIKAGYDAEQTGLVIKPLDYVKSHPYGTALMILSSYLLLAVWYYIGELSYVLSILTGVGCDNAFTTLRARAEGKLLK